MDEDRINLDAIDGIWHHDQQRPVEHYGNIHGFQTNRSSLERADGLPLKESRGEIEKGVQALVGEHEDVAFGAQDAISPLSQSAEMQCRRRLIGEDVTDKVDRTIEPKGRHGEREAVHIECSNIHEIDTNGSKLPAVVLQP